MDGRLVRSGHYLHYAFSRPGVPNRQVPIPVLECVEFQYIRRWSDSEPSLRTTPEPAVENSPAAADRWSAWRQGPVQLRAWQLRADHPDDNAPDSLRYRVDAEHAQRDLSRSRVPADRRHLESEQAEQAHHRERERHQELDEREPASASAALRYQLFTRRAMPVPA